MSTPVIGSLCTKAESFVADGFAVLPGFLDANELRQVQTLLAGCDEVPPGMTCIRPNNTLVPLTWNSPVIGMMFSDQRLSRIAAATRANDLRWISGYLSIKDAHSPALWWHTDWWCWNHPVTYRRSAPQVAVLCYLQSTTPENGALRVLPGSHLRSSHIHALLPEAHSLVAEQLDPVHVAMADHPDQLTLCLEAGDAVVLDYRLLHSTHGNATSHPRDCILLSFTPSWSTLPEDIRAHLIDHPAQPRDIAGKNHLARILPNFHGIRRTLALNRTAPASFEITREE